MPDSMQSVAVIVIALLPGALYVWAFERQVGRWGVGLSDRVLRFIGGSAVFNAVVAPVPYWLWTTQWTAAGSHRGTSWWLWPVAVVYVGLPFLGGTLVGAGVRRGMAWTRWITGPDPAPRAWDHLFGQREDGWVRLKMKSGSWIGGAFADANGRRAYAAGYPEVQDLYLAAAVELDPDTGAFLLDEDGEVALLEGGILVRWEEVEHLEFIDA